MDRRGFLRAGGLAVALVGGGRLLPACSAGPVSGPQASPSSTPSSGGILRAAFVGGGATETLNHLTGPTALDYVRARSRHAALGAVDPSQPDGVRYDALDTIEVSDDLATYTLRVRSGLTFTDGSAVTARDILYSLNAPVTFGALPFLLGAANNFDLAAARVDGDDMLVLQALRPIVDGRLVLCQSNLVFKDGTTEFTVDMPTCGPFRMTGFDPGQGASYVRHEGYTAPEGVEGPFLERLELRSIADGDARASALTGGQVDFADDLPLTATRTLENMDGVRVTQAELPFVTQLSFSLNVGQAPFTDPRVVEAVKLAVDRQGIVDTVFLGRAVVGNDLPSIGFPDYDADIEQRQHDPDRARQLIRETGAEGAVVTLTTGPEIPGLVEAATVVAENLTDVGMVVSLNELPPGQLYSDYAAYTQSQLAGGYNPPQSFLSSYQTTRTAGSPSTFGFDRPDIDDLVATARGSAERAERQQALEQAQRLIWAEGNVVIPVFKPALAGAADTVQGVRYEPFPNFVSAAVQ